jgi:hypothetical protein
MRRPGGRRSTVGATRSPPKGTGVTATLHEPSLEQLVVELVSLVDDDTGSARDRLSLSACGGARGVRAAHEARQTRQGPAPGHIVDRGGPPTVRRLVWTCVLVPRGRLCRYEEGHRRLIERSRSNLFIGLVVPKRCTGIWAPNMRARLPLVGAMAGLERRLQPKAGRTAAGLCTGARCRPGVGRRRMPNEWPAPASVPCSVPDAGRGTPPG